MQATDDDVRRWLEKTADLSLWPLKSIPVMGRAIKHGQHL